MRLFNLLKNICLKLLKKTEIVKLWENASPTSSFLPQDLPIDISGFDILEIAFRDTGNLRMSIKLGTWKSAVWASYPTGGVWVGYRGCAVMDSNTVRIGDCYVINHQNVTALYNNYCVPTQIYGIKGVQ